MTFPFGYVLVISGYIPATRTKNNSDKIIMMTAVEEESPSDGTVEAVTGEPQQKLHCLQHCK